MCSMILKKALGTLFDTSSENIYIFIAIALDESIFLDVLHFTMKNIKSRDLEAMPIMYGRGDVKTHPVTLFVYSCCRDVGHVSP